MGWKFKKTIWKVKLQWQQPYVIVRTLYWLDQQPVYWNKIFQLLHISNADIKVNKFWKPQMWCYIQKNVQTAQRVNVDVLRKVKEKVVICCACNVELFYKEER
uniref:Uncharacterized protein n=1 Tax=Arion vulgaris TaxID=1028688 RepID=A0A0B7BDG8_9EUPU